MHIPDSLTHILLLVTKETVLVPFVAIGYLAIDRFKFARCLYILLITMVFSTFLKSIWQIPLPVHIQSESWAFPSGHMMVAVTFWGWLAYEYKKAWLTILSLLLTIGVGFSLISKGYHTPLDILGGVGFGIVTMILFAVLTKAILPNQSYHPFLGFALAAMGYGLIYLIPKTFSHLWLAEGALVGFSLGWLLRESLNYHPKNKVVVLAISFTGAALIYLGFGHVINVISMSKLPSVFTQYCLLSFWLSFGGVAVSRVFSR